MCRYPVGNPEIRKHLSDIMSVDIKDFNLDVHIPLPPSINHNTYGHREMILHVHTQDVAIHGWYMDIIQWVRDKYTCNGDFQKWIVDTQSSISVIRVFQCVILEVSQSQKKDAQWSQFCLACMYVFYHCSEWLHTCHPVSRCCRCCRKGSDKHLCRFVHLNFPSNLK